MIAINLNNYQAISLIIRFLLSPLFPSIEHHPGTAKTAVRNSHPTVIHWSTVTAVWKARSVSMQCHCVQVTDHLSPPTNSPRGVHQR